MFQASPQSLSVLLLSCIGLVSLATATAAPELLTRPQGPDGGTLPESAIPPLPASHIGRILSEYYSAGFGGAENWERVSSLRLEGEISTAEGQFEFSAYCKKPNLFKILVSSDECESVSGYDGVHAWKHRLRPKSSPEILSDTATVHWLQHAVFCSHLLYPYAEGKVIRYIDTLPVEGKLCNQVQVELDNGDQFNYFIDIHTHLLVQCVHFDHDRGRALSLTYDDYTPNESLPLPDEIVYSENGEWVGSLKLAAVGINAGIMPWMFQLPN
ncbi:MAG: hypothetical protein ACI81V_000465 [Lentimonas sp.]|jgi:hypothetical protein